MEIVLSFHAGVDSDRMRSLLWPHITQFIAFLQGESDSWGPATREVPPLEAELLSSRSPDAVFMLEWQMFVA